MSISSVSLTCISRLSAPAASTPVAAAPVAANDAAVQATPSCEGRGQARRNVLYDAMMSALRELGLGQKPAQPVAPGNAPSATAVGSTTASPASGTLAVAPATAAPTTPASDAAAAAAPQSAATPAPSIEDAVLSFAHALWQALRGSDGDGFGRGHSRGDDEGDQPRHHHGHHRHHDHGQGMARDYSGLATRLEALAVRFETGPAAAPATTPASTPVPTAAAATAPAGTIVPIKLPGTNPVRADASAPSDQGLAPMPVALPVVAAKNPLVDAFAAMLKLLRGAESAPGTRGAPEASLSSFLHSLARGLEMDHSMPAMSAVGTTINISA